MASAKLVDELSCNNYAGVISLTNTTSPFDATGLGEQGSLCPPLANVKGFKTRPENKKVLFFEVYFQLVKILILVKLVAIQCLRQIWTVIC